MLGQGVDEQPRFLPGPHLVHAFFGNADAHQQGVEVGDGQHLLIILHHVAHFHRALHYHPGDGGANIGVGQIELGLFEGNLTVLKLVFGAVVLFVADQPAFKERLSSFKGGARLFKGDLGLLEAQGQLVFVELQENVAGFNAVPLLDV